MAFLQAVARYEGKAREIMSREGPPAQATGEASRMNPDEAYQGEGSFTRLFTRVDSEITKRFPAAGLELSEEDRAEANRTSDEIDALWVLGESQEAEFAAETSETYQAFRQALIKWYRFWIQAINGNKPEGKR